MLSIIMDYRMVPPLSALSLALCHEALEGGGYQQIHKKKLPQCEIMDPYTGKQLFRFARHAICNTKSLCHKVAPVS